MEPQRTLGRTGIPTSAIGLACNYGIDATGIERAFHELGVRYFFVTPRTDAAKQGIKNLVAQGHRDELTIATGTGVPFGFMVRRELDRALSAFGVDHFDVFHLFWVQAHWYVTGNTWKAMRRAKEAGLTKSIGISCHDRLMARALVDELDLDLLMLRYNAAHRGAESEVFATK